MKKLLLLVATRRRRARARRRRRRPAAWATVGLSSLPKPGLAAGEPWVVTIRVMQHGRTPLAGAKPEVRIRNGAGKLFRSRRRPTAPRLLPRPGRVPGAGRYSLGVYDGFVPHCASVHTFKSVVIVPV